MELAPLMSSVLTVARSRLGANVVVHTEVEEGLTVMGNESGLSQVLLNIVFNAADAMKETKAPCLQIRGAREGDRAKLVLRDNGPGIPAHVAKQIFTPFYTSKPEGTGLGLSISHKIVESHGGTLTFETGAWGTAFVVTLPLARAIQV